MQKIVQSQFRITKILKRSFGNEFHGQMRSPFLRNHVQSKQNLIGNLKSFGREKRFASSFLGDPSWSVSKFIQQDASKSQEISEELIRKLADASRLNLKEEQLPLFQKDIQQILGFVEHVQDYSPALTATQDANEKELIQGQHLHLKRFLIENSSSEVETFPTELILSNAQQKERTFFAVPKIKDDEES